MVNFNIEKTKNHLLRLCTNTKKADPESFKNFRKMWSRKGISVFLENEDIKEFNEAMDEIRKDEFIKHNFTEKFIETKLEDIISEALKLPQRKIVDFIKKELDDLKLHFKKEIKEWIFIVPIENLSVKRPFSVGDVKFYVFNDYRKNKIKKLFWNMLKNNKHYTDDQKRKHLKIVQKHYIEPNSGLTCAEVKVKGVLENAQQIALHKIRLAISVLKLYNYTNDDFYGRYFGILGEVIKNTNRVIIRYTTNERTANPLLEKVGYFFKYELDKNRIKFMKKKGFEKLNEMLKQSNLNDFETRLLTSIYWFGDAMNLQVSYDKKNQIHEEKTIKHENLEYFKLSERFLKLFTSLECILIFSNREPITNNIAERSALLLAKKYTDRKEIKAYVKKLYRIRSKIIHHGEVFVSKYDLAYLTNLVQAIIIILIKSKDRLNLKTHNDLYVYFEKLKFN